jgi:hypothetical protein
VKSKVEFPSLLSAGIHDVQLSDLQSRFVFPFANQVQRQYVLSRFLVFYHKLLSFGISLEIWINGSFTTQKENPDDIDTIIFGDPVEINKLPHDKQVELSLLLNNSESKIRYSCDVYFSLSNDVIKRSYWRGWFGFTRNEEAKGFVRLVR